MDHKQNINRYYNISEDINFMMKNIKKSRITGSTSGESDLEDLAEKMVFYIKSDISEEEGYWLSGRSVSRLF